ncbi:MAG TPA: hypothetical protein VGM16_00960 [Gammaproteobacteria bacterium]|jgi:hypothetical protein
MDKPVAKLSLIGRRSDAEPFPITLEIGTPRQLSEDPEEWGCPVSLTPLYSRLHDAHGVDSFQALCLAIALAQDLLQGFKEEGGMLTYGDDSGVFTLEGYSFRPRSLE